MLLTFLATMACDRQRHRGRAAGAHRLRPAAGAGGGPRPLRHLGPGPAAGAGLFDALQLLLVVCALVVDAIALWAIAARISEFGWSPNKVAALGENLILLVTLGGSAVLYARFLAGRAGFTALERWQTAYLPVYALWAWVVVVAFPPLFGFR